MSSEIPDDPGSDGSAEWGPRVESRPCRGEDDRLEELVTAVSHDLRNQVSVASGRVELARELDGEDRTEALETAMEALDRMGELIGDLSAYAGQYETVANREPVDLDRVAESAWRTIPTPAATLTVETSGAVEADPSRLACLFENLLRNAVEHGSTSPRSHAPEDAVEHGSTSPDSHGSGVTVRVGDLEDGFYVADDGPGIPPGERDRVFEPGHTTAEDGTGVGLFAVAAVADAHGWTVSVSESSEGGARFEVRSDDRPVRCDDAAGN